MWIGTQPDDFQSLALLRFHDLCFLHAQKLPYPLIVPFIYPFINLLKRGDSSTYGVQSQYWVLELQMLFFPWSNPSPSWETIYIQIIRCRRIPLIIEKVTKLLGMQAGGGRVDREGFTKEKILELGFKGYVKVYQLDSGGRKF